MTASLFTLILLYCQQPDRARINRVTITNKECVERMLKCTRNNIKFSEAILGESGFFAFKRCLPEEDRKDYGFE